MQAVNQNRYSHRAFPSLIGGGWLAFKKKKKNDPPIIAFKSYLHHSLKMACMVVQPAPKICKIIVIWIYLTVLLHTVSTMYTSCHGSS